MKIWRDTHSLRIFFLIFFYAILIMCLRMLIINTPDSAQSVILAALIVSIPVFVLINIHRNRLVFVNKKGIRVGNTLQDNYEKIILPCVHFLQWEEISNIKIINRVVTHNTRSVLRPFLNIKSRDGKRYECFIANPDGFKEALKKLNKSNLFVKEAPKRYQ